MLIVLEIIINHNDVTGFVIYVYIISYGIGKDNIIFKISSNYFIH